MAEFRRAVTDPSRREAELLDAEPGDHTAHVVQFYETDTFLVDTVSRYMTEALTSGRGAFVVATPPHLHEIERSLATKGLDVRALATAGQYVALNAEHAVAAFVTGGGVDRDRLSQEIGGRLESLLRAWPGVNVFAEMVAVLWSRDLRTEACELEDWWNERLRGQRIRLLCAYPLGLFGGDRPGSGMEDVCARHAQVIPAESYSALATRREQSRLIACLQQRAIAFEAERATRNQLEREFQDFIENAVEGLHKVGPDGTVLWANRAELELLGYTAEEYIGHHIREFHADQAAIDEMLTRLARGETLRDHPARLRCKDGSIRHVRISSNALFVEGRFVYTRCFTRDVTDLHRSEQERRDREEGYHRLTQLLPVGVYTCEAPSGAITYFNDQAARLWGRAPALGDTDERFCGSLRLYTPDGTLLAHDECPMAVALTSGREFRNQEVEIERPDGSRVTVLVNIDPLRAGGTVVGAVNVFHDITELRRAEGALREADRRKDEFLATLGHELRNPLAPIRSSLDILRMSGAPADGAPLLDIMDRQLRHLVRLVDDLLELSRISRGTIELQNARVDVPTIVNSALETSRPLLTAAGHQLTVLLPDEPLMVWGDAVRLSQVFANLLNNAAKYTPSGGRVVVRAAREDERILVSVRDTGIGIPAEMLPRLFEMFVRVPRPEGPAGDGLGIGLSVARTLVTMHGGAIEVRSDGPGRGTEFLVRLPLADARNVAPEAATAGAAVG